MSEIIRNPIYVKADIDLYNFYSSRNTEIVNPPDDFIGENGCYLYTKNVSNNAGTHKNMSQYDNMVLVLAPHKGIVDSDTWIKCRMKSEKNKQIPNAKRAKVTWLSGKLKCGLCGYALRYNKWVGKTKENEYFLCSETSSSRRCGGFGVVKKAEIENEALKHLRNRVAEIKIEQSKPDKNYAEINSIKSEIAKKEASIQEILNRLEDANEAVLKYINQRVEALDREITALKTELLKFEVDNTSRQQFNPDMIEAVFDSWDMISIDDRQAVADVMIKKVLITNKSMEFVWHV